MPLSSCDVCLSPPSSLLPSLCCAALFYFCLFSRQQLVVRLFSFPDVGGSQLLCIITAGTSMLVFQSFFTFIQNAILRQTNVPRFISYFTKNGVFIGRPPSVSGTPGNRVSIMSSMSSLPLALCFDRKRILEEETWMTQLLVNRSSLATSPQYEAVFPLSAFH